MGMYVRVHSPYDTPDPQPSTRLYTDNFIETCASLVAEIGYTVTPNFITCTLVCALSQLQ